MKPALSQRPPLISRYTFHLHLKVSLLGALFFSVVHLKGVIARKSLHASDLEILILTTAFNGFLIFGYLISRVMEGRPKKPYILFSAIAGRGSLILIAFVDDATIFVTLSCVYFFSETFYITAWNSIMQLNYHADWRGRLFSKVNSFASMILLASSLFVAWWLDIDPNAYRILYPIAGLVGLLSYYKASRIKVRKPIMPQKRNEFNLQLISNSLSSFVSLLKNHKNFFLYELSFFIYGVAFMILLPINVFLMVNELEMSYKEISFASVICFQLGMISFYPLTGRIFDKLKAIKTSALFFAFISFYPLFMMVAYFFHAKEFVIIAYIAFGMALAGIMLTWNLGVMHFSKDQDSAVFMGIHITSVGVRAIIGPAIGFLLTKYISFIAAFVIAILLFLLSSYGMFRLALIEKKETAK